MRTKSIILAAGQGTRMHSALPKVLHHLLGRPMAWYAVDTALKATGSQPVVVVGYGAENVMQALGETALFVRQEPQLGTGHAVLQARPLLEGKCDLVLVTYADMPLLKPETLSRLIETQSSHNGPFSMLTILGRDPRGFGRVLRNPQGQVEAIIEEAQASPDQLVIRELNASVYCFSARWLWKALDQIPVSPKGEYYLTDLVGIATSEGLKVLALTDEETIETIGINTRLHLAEAEAALRLRINQDLMLSGVTLIDPQTTTIEPGVSIGRDSIVWPNTYLHGATRIGEETVIGPNTIIKESEIGNRCKIVSSVIEGAILEDDVEIGPFAHLRKGAHLGRGVHMGNFGEVKNSYLGPGSKVGHFSYLGDATIGSNVNIGAGTITCNFDGYKKYPTEIGNEAFIGSDTMLVAPVKVGEGARTGAGAVVTKNIPPDTLAVGMPARSIRKLEKRE